MLIVKHYLDGIIMGTRPDEILGRIPHDGDDCRIVGSPIDHLPRLHSNQARVISNRFDDQTGLSQSKKMGRRALRLTRKTSAKPPIHTLLSTTLME